MGIIILENIKIYSNHGCLEEEARIGSDYLVDLEVEADFSQACETDELIDAVDYVLLNKNCVCVEQDKFTLRYELRIWLQSLFMRVPTIILWGAEKIIIILV